MKYMDNNETFTHAEKLKSAKMPKNVKSLEALMTKSVLLKS